VSEALGICLASRVCCHTWPCLCHDHPLRQLPRLCLYFGLGSSSSITSIVTTALTVVWIVYHGKCRFGWRVLCVFIWNCCIFRYCLFLILFNEKHSSELNPTPSSNMHVPASSSATGAFWASAGGKRRRSNVDKCCYGWLVPTCLKNCGGLFSPGRPIVFAPIRYESRRRIVVHWARMCDHNVVFLHVSQQCSVFQKTEATRGWSKLGWVKSRWLMIINVCTTAWMLYRCTLSGGRQVQVL